jgi:large subunit ribosomal protein L9
MKVILLERVEKLGNLGDEVNVKPGFARNYLLPQGKALRSTPDNVAYFAQERKAIEAANTKRRDAASADAKKIDGLTITLIRQASEGGQLYGSVAAKDISDAINAEGKSSITRGQVDLNMNLKTLGLFTVPVVLHPEVKVAVTINIARTVDEAAAQLKAGKAIITETAVEEIAEVAAEEVSAA